MASKSHTDPHDAVLRDPTANRLLSFLTNPDTHQNFSALSVVTECLSVELRSSLNGLHFNIVLYFKYLILEQKLPFGTLTPRDWSFKVMKQL